MVTIQGQLGESRAKAMQEVQNKFVRYQNICGNRQKKLLANVEADVSDRFACTVLCHRQRAQNRSFW